MYRRLNVMIRLNACALVLLETELASPPCKVLNHYNYKSIK